ncbi:MAG: tRNA uracil 4-sulfurtransferase [Clostridiales bacterium]|nr:tRNA uracil 4-sulfurtransferase [Clostridiales bacterium]
MEERELILIRYGEIALKGKNIGVFQKKLVKNIKKALVDVPNIHVLDHHGRVYVEHDHEDYEKIVERVTKVFGIVSISPAHRTENKVEAICTAALEEAKRLIHEEGIRTFKIETRRANKGFPMTSPEISRHVGGYVNQKLDELSVDVHTPDAVIHIEIRNSAYIFSKRIQAIGGMPYGSAGKGMLLLSGGIDSPVAGYSMARRGLELEAVHFHSYPFTSERAAEKVVDLAIKMTVYTTNLRIYKVNILEIQRAIQEFCPQEEMTILSRCFMMKIAEKLANESGCKALVTGENMGQVASQTLESITVTNAMTEMPIFRPLIAYDKSEIVEKAQEIDTFETSILPFEDCCTVFLPERVVTKPRLEKIQESLDLLDVEGLIDRAIENRELVVVSRGKQIENPRY